MNEKRESELTVITRAKECCSYVLQITDLAPKKYRYTLLGKMQMYSLDVIEYLYMANCVRMVRTITSQVIGCITPKQHKLIVDKVFEIQRLLYAWQQSDVKRLAER